MRRFIALCVVVCAAAATADAAPYETVLVYSKTGSPGSAIEVTLEDLMTKQSKDVTLPTEFTDEDGTFYRLTSIKEQLDVEGIDKHYLAPYWDFSVSISIDHQQLPELNALLSEAHPNVEWSLPRLLADRPGAKHFISLNIRGSYGYQYLCGLETLYREKNGKDMPSELAKLVLTRDPKVKLPAKTIMQGPSPILYSFCDNVITDDSHIESVDWPLVFKESHDHAELSFGHTSGSIEEVREAHKHALVLARSEERRVGKECRSRWSPYH